MVGNSEISYEPLKVLGNVSENGPVLDIETTEYRNVELNDKLFFIREDGSLRYRDSKQIVSVEKTPAGGHYSCEMLTRRYPLLVSATTIDIYPYPTATSTEKYVELTFENEHFFNADPVDRQLNNVFYPDIGFVNGRRCVGDLIKFDKLYLRAISVSDGDYVYPEMVLENTRADIFYVDLEGAVHHVPCIVPSDDSSRESRFKLLFKYDSSDTSDAMALVSRDFISLYTYDARFLRLENFVSDGISTYSLTKGTTICTEEGNCHLSVPFGQDFETDLGREEALLEHFYAEVDGQINKIVDFEKQSFSPVYRDGSGKWKDVSKLVFNVHLRDRSVSDDGFELDPEWKYDEQSYWNNYPDLDPDCQNGYDEQCHLIPKDEDMGVGEADLVGYAGFEDEDIYYQRKKVSNTFIRVSIYNTPNRGDQKLLYSAKIYLNPGLLYGKYVKQLRKEPVEGEEDIPVVFREGDKENRLGLSFVCTHKYDYDNPSEGFYFHLFPSNLSESASTEVYMKVEFNNAKYGYSIQLTMPEKNGDGTFDEMGGDSTMVPIDPESNDFPKTYIYYVQRPTQDNKDGVIKVDMARLARDMYIPVRIRYDVENKRYVWFLPTSGDLTDNTMVFNLFEPRVNGIPYRSERFDGYGTYSGGNSENGNSGDSNTGGNSGGDTGGGTEGGNTGENTGGDTGGSGGQTIPDGPDPESWSDPEWDEDPENVSLEIKFSPAILTNEAGEAELGITANTRWYITVEGNKYLTFSKTKGSGNDTVAVTYTENTSAGPRNAKVSVCTKLNDPEKDICRSDTIIQRKRVLSNDVSET